MIALKQFQSLVLAFLAIPSAAISGEPAKPAPILDRLQRSEDVADAPLSMRSRARPPTNALAAWQKEFAAKLTTLLGPHPAPPMKWKTTVVSVKEFDDPSPRRAAADG